MNRHGLLPGVARPADKGVVHMLCNATGRNVGLYGSVTTVTREWDGMKFPEEKVV